MREHRRRAADGGLPVPTKVWLKFRVFLMKGWMVLMPLRPLFPGRQQGFLVAELVWMQFLNFRPDRKRRLRPAPGERFLRLREFRSPSTELPPRQVM